MKDPQKQSLRELEKQLEKVKLKVLAYRSSYQMQTTEGTGICKTDEAKQITSLPEPTLENEVCFVTCLATVNKLIQTDSI